MNALLTLILVAIGAVLAVELAIEIFYQTRGGGQ